jgi:hypothetical protein
MLQFIGFALAAALVLFGYTATKTFVRTRLRFVDGALSRSAPIVAGAMAFFASLPLFWFLPLPFFGLGTSMILGVSIGAGVAAGAREVREAAGYIRGS